MDIKDLKGLMEAYQQINAPQEVDEAVKGADPEMRKAASAERRGGDRPLPKKEGEKNAAHMARKIRFSDKVTKAKGHIPGYTYAEEVEQIDEISQKTATRAFATRATGEFEYDTNPSDRTKSGKSKADVAKGRIEKKFGKKAGEHAERAAHAQIFGRKGAGGMPSVKEELDIFDIVLEFLQVEGYAETLEEAEWLMANLLDKEVIDIIVEAMHEDEEEDEEDEKEMKKGKKSKKEKEEEDEDEEEEELDEATYSAKAARAGKDIGKPGKQFAKIAKSAAKRYGSEERGKKVAGAILAKLRAKRG